MLALCSPDFHLKMFSFSRWASIQLTMLFLYPPSKSWLAIYGCGTQWIAFCKIFGADFFMFLFHKVNKLLSFFLRKSWGADASRAWERCTCCLEHFEAWIYYTLLLVQFLWSFIVPLFLQHLIIRSRYVALVALPFDICNTFWRSYTSQRYYIWSRSSWSICFYRL